MPHFLLGDFIRKYRGKIRGNNIALCCLLVLTSVTSVLENKFLAAGQSMNKDYFISTLFMAVCIFLLTDRNEEIFSREPFRKIADLGRKYSLRIYLFHPFWIFLLQILLTKKEWSERGLFFCKAVLPFAVLILSTLTAWMGVTIYKKFSGRK